MRLLSSGLCVSGLWEVALISSCPPECISAQLQEEAAAHPISPISTSLYSRWFGPSLGRWKMWFGSLQAEEGSEARFLTLWASTFANSYQLLIKCKRCVHLCLGPRFKKSEQNSVLSACRCLPSGMGSAIWNLNGGRYFALHT